VRGLNYSRLVPVPTYLRYLTEVGKMPTGTLQGHGTYQTVYEICSKVQSLTFRKHQIYLIGGSIPELSEGRLFNTATGRNSSLAVYIF
jgi:hypothetical protein